MARQASDKAGDPQAGLEAGASSTIAIGSNAPTANEAADASAACTGRARRGFGDAEFVAGVGRERIVRGKAGRDLVGELGRQPALDVDADQFIGVRLPGSARVPSVSLARSAASVSACGLTDTYSPAAIDIAPPTRPATRRAAPAAGRPAPRRRRRPGWRWRRCRRSRRAAARNQPARSLRWRSAALCGLRFMSAERHAAAPAIIPLRPRIMPFMPPRPSLPIIFSICWYCFISLLTSAGASPRAAGDARARAVDERRVAAFLLRHRIDDGDLARDFLAGDLALHVVGDLAHARQLVHQPVRAAHVLHLLDLVAQVVEVEALALATFSASFAALSLSTCCSTCSTRPSTSPMSRDAAGARAGWNTSRPSVFSPVPTNLIGLPVM